MIGYLICTSPRSGSSALCSALRSTGVMGWPVEHFNRSYVAKLVVPPSDLETYVRAVIRGPGISMGVCASKLFWFQLEFAKRSLAAEMSVAQVFELLLKTCDHPKVVRLVRKDKMRQAISYARAVKSGVWRVSRATENPPNVLDASDFASVESWIARFLAWEGNWDALLERFNVAPILLCYEDIMGDWRSGVDSVAARLGIDLTDVDRAGIITETARQSDPATEEFLQAFDSWRSTRPSHDAMMHVCPERPSG